MSTGSDVLQKPLPKWLFPAALWLLVAGELAPLWLSAAPPLQDYPQHLFNVAVLLDPPGGPLGQYYLAQWHLGPYTSVYAVIALLAQVVGLQTAGRLTLSLVGLATGLAILALDRHLRRENPDSPRRYGLLLWLPLSFAQCWFLGLVNWCLAVPLATWALVQHAELRVAPARFGPLARHATLVLLVNLTHPFAGLAYGGLALVASLWPIAGAKVRRRGLLQAVAALAVTLVLLAAAGLGGPAVTHEFIPPNWAFAAVFAVMPALGMLGARGLDWPLLLLWLATIALLVWTWRRDPLVPWSARLRQHGWWVVLAASLVGYLVLPQADVGIQYFYLNLRLIALIYALLAVLAGHLALAPRPALALLALLVGIVGLGAAKQGRVGDEIGQVLPLVEHLPPESKLLPLTADPTSPELQPQMFQPHIHAGYYHPIVHRAGFVPYGFSTALNPVHLRPGAERPAPPQTQPGKFRSTEHWADYDHALVRAPNPKLLQRLLKHAQVVGQSGPWLLLRRTAANAL